MDRLILASQSPRRKQLLEWARIEFDVLVSDVEENYPASMPVGEIPMHIAQKKADHIAAMAGVHRLILAADTIVVLEGRVLGKPANREEAIEMLAALQGKDHEVITGVVIRQADRTLRFADSTQVSFHPLTREQIIFYVDNYHPFDKAGAYGIQDWIGVVGIRAIRGDFYNVMGLPISRVVQALENWS